MEYQKEQRKSRRFTLRQTAIVRHHDGFSHQLNAETLNASLHGVLLSMPEIIPDASRVEVEIRLSRDGTQHVSLRGEGRVVRNETRRAGGFGIAVAFDQPLSEKSHAAATAKPANQPHSAPKGTRHPKVR